MKRFLFIPAFLLFAGCSYNTPSKNTTASSDVCMTQPSWVLNPPVEKGAIYGVGIAPENFKGVQAQRESAIAKAINEIATQYKTKVNSQTVIQSTVHNKHISKYMNSVSFQTVNGESVSAKIIKSCTNPQTGYLYVLMKAKK